MFQTMSNSLALEVLYRRHSIQRTQSNNLKRFNNVKNILLSDTFVVFIMVTDVGTRKQVQTLLVSIKHSCSDIALMGGR